MVRCASHRQHSRVNFMLFFLVIFSRFARAFLLFSHIEGDSSILHSVLHWSVEKPTTKWKSINLFFHTLHLYSTFPKSCDERRYIAVPPTYIPFQAVWASRRKLSNRRIPMMPWMKIGISQRSFPTGCPWGRIVELAGCCACCCLSGKCPTSFLDK
jgi:hypothetical protein